MWRPTQHVSVWGKATSMSEASAWLHTAKACCEQHLSHDTCHVLYQGSMADDVYAPPVLPSTAGRRAEPALAYCLKISCRSWDKPSLRHLLHITHSLCMTVATVPLFLGNKPSCCSAKPMCHLCDRLRDLQSLRTLWGGILFIEHPVRCHPLVIEHPVGRHPLH